MVSEMKSGWMKFCFLNFLYFTLFFSGCTLAPQKVFIELPNVSFSENPKLEAILKIIAFWGRKVQMDKLDKINSQPFRFSEVEKICKQNSMICVYPFADVKLIMDILRNNLPIIGLWIEEAFAPGWASINYNYRWSYIINGYDLQRDVLYLTLPTRKETLEYPISSFTRIWWAGRKENLILLIIPEEKLTLTKRLIPPEALKKAKEYVKLQEEESTLLKSYNNLEEKIERIKVCFEVRRRIVNNFPNWAFANYLIGYPLFMTGKREEGLKYLKKAYRLERSPFYLIALSSAYLTQGNIKEAIKVLRECNFDENVSSLSYIFLRVYIRVKNEEWQEAEEMIRRAKEHLAGFDSLKRNLGLIYAFIKFEEGKPEEAVAELEKLKKSFPEPYFKAFLFRIYIRLGNYKEALKLGKEVDNFFELYEPEIILLSTRSIEERIRVLKNVSKTKWVGRHLLFSYIEAGKWREAERLLCYDKYLDLKWVLSTPPSYVIFGPPYNLFEAGEILSTKGIIEYHKGNREEAEKLFQQALKYAEEPISLFSPLKANALLTPKAYLGIIFHQKGEKETAKKYLREAFSKNVPFLGEKEARKIAQKLGLL